MISVDANILLYGVNPASPFFGRARRFLDALTLRDDVAVSEFVLVEFYTLLRNPAVLVQPLGGSAAVEVVQAYRRHPRWMLLGCDVDSVALHDELWPRAAETTFARRRIYDLRLALILRRQGVTSFATVNVKDFHDLGFDRVWNPME